MKTINLTSLDLLSEASKQFIQLIGDHKIFAFQGEMGAGKTTFIKAICQQLGVIENITSPTFAIVNEYIASNDTPIYHFDCYRLKNIEEAFNIGAEDYFYSGNLCFIEWPEKIEDILPSNTVVVKIKVKPDKSREIILNI